MALLGLVLLWGSRAWTLGEKLLGTFVIPFGLAGSLWFASILAGGTSQTGGCALPVHTLARCVVATKTSKASMLEIVVGIVILIAPVLTAWSLYRQTRDRLGAAPAVP